MLFLVVLHKTCTFANALYGKVSGTASISRSLNVGSRDTCITSYLYINIRIIVKICQCPNKAGRMFLSHSYHCHHDFHVFYDKYTGFNILTKSKGDNSHIFGALFYTTTAIQRGGVAIHRGSYAN